MYADFSYIEEKEILHRFMKFYIVLSWIFHLLMRLLLLQQHYDKEFQKIVSKFEICMKNGSRVTINDKIPRAVPEQLHVVLLPAKKRYSTRSAVIPFIRPRVYIRVRIDFKSIKS